MNTKELIRKEVENLPEALQRKSMTSLDSYVKNRGFNGSLLSESALTKEWDTPEEDAAWVNL